MSFCVKCGSDVLGKAFCLNCGASSPSQIVDNSSSPIFQIQPEQPGPEKQPNRSKKAILLSLVASVGVLVIIGIALWTGGPTPLERAYQSCVPNPSTFDGVSLDDDGRGMFIDMEGEEDLWGADYSDIVCVLADLEVPRSVQSQIDNTSALMGVKSASWDGITASWSYHPDRGLDMNFSLD